MKALLTFGLMSSLVANLAGANPKVARVLFAECGGMSSPREVFLVASVMKNRIQHPGFGNGKLKTMMDVAYQPRAFSCIGSRQNGNWTLGKDAMGRRSAGMAEADIRAWNQSMMLARGQFEPEPDIVYYHDKSISMPQSWNNKYWTTVKRIETEHFVFYAVEPAKNI